MNALVVDASVAASAVEGATRSDRELFSRLRASDVHAPHLIDTEVGHVLRRRVRQGLVDANHAVGALLALEHLIQSRYVHTSLVAAAWSLRDNLSFYDALYVALATRLGVPLLTSDIRLANAPGVTCTIETIG
jgi:predicted nucleic acid-binding protein